MDSMPDFLVIGHITRDLLPEGGFVQGGAATYAAVAALRLGVRPAILTRAAPDSKLIPALAGVPITRLPAAVTTTFENRYFDGHRRQVVHAAAPPITAANVPPAWQNIPIVLLGPVAQEVDSALAGAFPNSIVGAAPQGWMRRWDAQGHVSRGPWLHAETVLPRIQALILSWEDLDHDPATLAYYCRLCPLVVLTLGARGCQVWQGERMTHVPPRPAHELDPTGAGDVFAAAFLIRLAAGSDPLQAARFANVVASFSVEGLATEAIPTLAQVNAYEEAAGAEAQDRAHEGATSALASTPQPRRQP